MAKKKKSKKRKKSTKRRKTKKIVRTKKTVKTKKKILRFEDKIALAGLVMILLFFTFMLGKSATSNIILGKATIDTHCIETHKDNNVLAGYCVFVNTDGEVTERCVDIMLCKNNCLTKAGSKTICSGEIPPGGVKTVNWFFTSEEADLNSGYALAYK